MKFSEVKQGTRSERPVTLEHRGVTHRFALRPMTGDEEGLALSRATAYAQGQHAIEAKPGNPLFDLGYMANVLAITSVDEDSPPEARQPYFDGGASQILAELGSEDIAYLHARQELFQQECSPTRSRMSGAELTAELVRIVEAEDDRPFSRLRPYAQWTLLRTTGALLLNSPEGRSRLTALFGPLPSSSTSKPQNESAKSPS